MANKDASKGGIFGFRRGRKKDLESLGTTPLRLAKTDGRGVLDLSGEVVHQYRQLYTRLTREIPLPKRLGLIAALRGEGVTTVGLGLATVLATDLEARFCLVETNWWWPGLAVLMDGFGTASPAQPKEEGTPGLGEVVTGQATLDDALRPTGNERLWLLPAGEVTTEDRPRLARSRAMSKTLEALNERFDHLLLDVPAILATGDAVPLAAQADGLCLVIRQGVTPLPLIRQALDQVEHLPIRGVVLNGERVATPRWLLQLIPEAFY